MSYDLTIPRFLRELLNPYVAPAKDGDAFQQFVTEILSLEYPGLHAYPGGGRDGGIDLVWPADIPEIFFECKHVGEDGLEAAEARWREVEDRLRRHLADPVGPGQSQYSPWYEADPPVKIYTFCLSSLLQNHGQRKKLRKRIRTFFGSLASKHAHLRHLGDVEVQLKDWEDWRSRLATRPHLVFRWFPKARPRGLLPLDTEAVGSGFREYLTNGRLPYYPRSAHKALVALPESEEILGEEQLLGELKAGSATGLVITGGGGLGKTRLMLELGRLAATRGWTALRVQGKLQEESLERLVEMLSPGTPTLLLIDYIETQPDYGALVEALDLLVDERQVPLRYIACCRSSFYPIIQGIGRHRRVDLSPQAKEMATWLEGFREATVRHIVTHLHLPSPERVEVMSRATPVLAVFAAWLQDQGKTGDLVELLGEPDFGTWVHKRIRQSFGTTTVGRDLARLVALLPMDEEVVESLGSESQALLDRLALDGWVGLHPTVGLNGQRWEAAHDVLADRVTLSYLETAPASTRTFVQELFDAAAPLKAVSSALTALQRIGSSPNLRDLPWKGLFRGAMERNPEAWRDARLLALRSPLLSVEDRALLLDSGAAFDGIEGDIAFQNQLGWMIRELSSQDPAGSVYTVLQSWLRRTAPHVEASNYLLTKGLLLFPADVRDESLRWLLKWPAQFQSHYLLSAWLATERNFEDVRRVAEQWLARFSKTGHASFVFKSWLDAGGERQLVQDFITPWLSAHGLTLEASFIFKSWLDAGGERHLVQDFITPWLSVHGLTPEASFIFRPWLDAGGERHLVQNFIKPWLSAHGLTLEAQFVFKSWLGAGGERHLVQNFIKPWLSAHGLTLEAQFVFKSWLGAGGERQLVQDFIKPWLSAHGLTLEASFIFKSWLDAGGERQLVQDFIKPWLSAHGLTLEASFIFKSWLDAGGERQLVQDFIKPWLSAHGFIREADFVFKSWLDAGGEHQVVQEFLDPWLKRYGLTEGASFVFTSWLDAGGSQLSIREGLSAWLIDHASYDEADHVLRAWLEAGGSFDFIREPACRWLSAHRESSKAVFLTKYIARQKNLMQETVQDILAWCRAFHRNPDALWRLTSLDRHLLHSEVAPEVIETTDIIVRELLSQVSLPSQVSSLLAFLFAVLGEDTRLRTATAALYGIWLRHPSSHIPPPPKPDGTMSNLHIRAQKPATLQYLRHLIQSGNLSVDHDRDSLLRLFTWIQTWEPEARLQVDSLLMALMSDST